MYAKGKNDYQLYYHKLQLIQVMKKIPKIQKVVANSNKTTPAPNLITHALNYLTFGLLAGVLFEGSYIFFGFQNRVIKGVTANRLQQIKKIEKDVNDSISKGEKPNINLNWLRNTWRTKFQKSQNPQNNKK